MLHILFLILKVILIILLSILGVIVLLALVILFVPIRYKIWFKKDDDIQARITVSWLLRIVLARAYYLDQKFRAIIRVFGYPVFDTLKQKKQKPKKEKTKKQKKGTKKGTKKKPDGPKNDTKVLETEIKVPETEGKDPQTVPARIREIEIHQTLGTEAQEQTESGVQTKIESDTQLKTEPEQTKLEQTKLEQTKLEQTKLEQMEPEQMISDTSKEETGFFSKIGSKITSIFEKIGSIGGKIKEFFVKLKIKGSNLKTKFKNIADKKDKLLAFWHEETNRQGISYAFATLVQILKEIGPEKIEGQIIFGTGDPASTGQALGVAAFFYGMYGQSIQITPDFEDAVFQADVTIKGRIRIIRLLIIGIRLIRDQNFKGLLKNVKRLKEEL